MLFKPGAQYIAAVDILRECVVDHTKHIAGAIRRERRQRHCFLNAENTRLRRTVRATGVDERLRFGDGHIRPATFITQHFSDFDSAAGAPGMQNNNLPIAQMRRHCSRHFGMRR
jgi:hypothetical protein